MINPSGGERRSPVLVEPGSARRREGDLRGGEREPHRHLGAASGRGDDLEHPAGVLRPLLDEQQPHVAASLALPQGLEVEALAIVGQGQPHRVAILGDGELDPVGRGVLGDVAHQLLDDPVDQAPHPDRKPCPWPVGPSRTASRSWVTVSSTRWAAACLATLRTSSWTTRWIRLRTHASQSSSPTEMSTWTPPSASGTSKL